MRRQKKKKEVKNVIILFIITLIISTYFSISKYMSTFAKDMSSRAAKYIIDLYFEDTQIINEAIKPNKYNEIYFEITGKKEEETSEVTTEYTIEIVTLNNLPLRFELYRDDNNDYNTNIDLEGNKTSKMLKEYNSENQRYKLKILWNDEQEDYNSAKFKKVLDYVKVIVDTEQKD